MFALSTMCVADEIRLRDGVTIQADSVWEQDGQIWYRQGQLVRSLPKSIVVAYGATLKAEALASIPQPTKQPTKQPTAKKLLSQLPSNNPVTNHTADYSNGARIFFVNGGQLDADATWEIDNKIAYRLGNMRALIEKSAIQRIEARDTNLLPQTTATTTNKEFSFTTGHAGLDQLIVTKAQQHDIDPVLIFLVMRQESSFNVHAVSRVGARGLMQLMPATARAFGVRNIHDPVENIDAGARYLKNLLQRFDGDVNLALAAYNAGEAAVARYGNRVPPYRETMQYVQRIGWAYYRAKQ